jgi:hypothetical protein
MSAVSFELVAKLLQCCSASSIDPNVKAWSSPPQKLARTLRRSAKRSNFAYSSAVQT